MRMKLRGLVEEVIWQGGNEILLFPFHLFSLGYLFLVQTRHTLYRFGWLKSRRLPCRVISVGNITLGGTGKTTVTLYIAHLLREKGKRVAILSRGYRGKVKDKVRVVADGREMICDDPRELGDEPVLLAKKLRNIPVLAGRDRFEAGKKALDFEPDVMVLDDGFQHLKLERDLDIVLLDSQVGFGNGHLLPRGILREPRKNLKRADVFLLIRRGNELSSSSPLETELNLYGKPIFHASYQPLSLKSLDGERKLEISILKGKKVSALSSIANPKSFRSLLSSLGAQVVRELAFPDHHLYSQRDLRRIERELLGMDLLVTTEKDRVKLGSFLPEKTPIFSLEIGLKVEEEEEFSRILTEK